MISKKALSILSNFFRHEINFTCWKNVYKKTLNKIFCKPSFLQSFFSFLQLSFAISMMFYLWPSDFVAIVLTFDISFCTVVHCFQVFHKLNKLLMERVFSNICFHPGFHLLSNFQKVKEAPALVSNKIS